MLEFLTWHEVHIDSSQIVVAACNFINLSEYHKIVWVSLIFFLHSDSVWLIRRKKCSIVLLLFNSKYANNIYLRCHNRFRLWQRLYFQLAFHLSLLKNNWTFFILADAERLQINWWAIALIFLPFFKGQIATPRLTKSWSPQ